MSEKTSRGKGYLISSCLMFGTFLWGLVWWECDDGSTKVGYQDRGGWVNRTISLTNWINTIKKNGAQERAKRKKKNWVKRNANRKKCALGKNSSTLERGLSTSPQWCGENSGVAKRSCARMQLSKPKDDAAIHYN